MIFTFEYSQSKVTINPKGKRIVIPDAFSHVGNIMRYYLSDYPENVPTPSFDTSYPALQGASGAPVIRKSDHAIVGMLVANHERHLIPAQVIRIDLEKGESEETKYFLPTGKAIVSDLIIEYLESLEIDIEIIR